MQIDITDLTTSTLPGDGAFDEIMTAMQIRLDREYKRNRITGPDYAKVYLGSFEASLMNSIQFILGRQEADAKAELLKEQTLTEIENRKLVDAQISKMKKEEALIDQQILKMIQEVLVMEGEVQMIPHKIALLQAEVVKMQKEGELIAGQIKKMEQEILLMKGQVEKMVSEIELMKKQVIKMDAEIRLMNAQADKTVEEVKLVKGQVEKMKSEILVMEQQVFESKQKVESMKAAVWAERAKTNSETSIFDDPYDPSNLNLHEVTGLVGMQIKKAGHEGELLGQKTVTEQAQTSDRVMNPKPGSTEYEVAGVIGKQKNLYQRQADGFLRDAEQKLAKIMTDTWNTQMVSQEGIEASPAGLGYADVCSVVNKAREGIVAGSGSCAGSGGNSGEIEGVTVDIIANTDVLEDCLATFESHVTIDNLPTVSIRSWYWSSPEGRDNEGKTTKGPWNRTCGSEGSSSANGQPCNGAIAGHTYGPHYIFETGFWEPGDNPVTLKIVLQDTDTESKYHNHEIVVTKNFHATATDGGCIGGVRPTNAKTTAEDAAAAAYSLAHPKEHDAGVFKALVAKQTGGTSVNDIADNILRTTEGHKGQP